MTAEIYKVDAYKFTNSKQKKGGWSEEAQGK
jgi:hypothetical protein